MKGVCGFSFLVLCSLLLGCEERKAEPIHPITEAYTYLDKGENAKAIALVEKAIKEDPGNLEAYTVLASAYLGQSGIDVFKVHEKFSDILFASSLDESLWGRPDYQAKKNAEIFKGYEAPPDAPYLDEAAPVEKFILLTEQYLENVRKTAQLFNRFPEVKEDKWPMLDRALDLLDQVKIPEPGAEQIGPNKIKAAKDIALYRVFIRIVYLKSFILFRLMRDESFGSHQWVCALNLDKFKEDLIWMISHLVKAGEDFVRVYPGRAAMLVRPREYMGVALHLLRTVRVQIPFGVEPQLEFIWRKLDPLSCKEP